MILLELFAAASAWALPPPKSNSICRAATCIWQSPARDFELAHDRPGTVLVVEDTSELLRAQRQLAWKEVAQRVAHEIKNPFTPIALSAERIGKHLDRGQAGFALHHSQVQRGDSGMRRNVAYARGSVFGAWRSFPRRSRVPAT